nr:STAS domain-containing protein [uncultured Desulfobacter sp.]
MVSTNPDDDGNLMMKIEGALSAYEVGELKEHLLTTISNYQSIVLDINDVTECDTLGIQLLLSACKTAEKLKKIFKITGDSQPIQDAIIGMGLEAEDFTCFSKEA